MSRFKNTVDQQKAHINTLRAALVGVVIICAAFGTAGNQPLIR